MMKTIQEHLRVADRKRLLDSLAYDEICDTRLLLELKDLTIEEIQGSCKDFMNRLIDHLLSIETVPSDHLVLYLCDMATDEGQYDKSLNLIDLNKLRKDINASNSSCNFKAWEESLGFLVADTKLTQDYIIDLLSLFLHEITFFGTDKESRQNKIDEVVSKLDIGMKNIKEGKTASAQEVFERIRKVHGWPIDEKDEIQDLLQKKIWDAENKYSRYCNWRERSRILESVGIAAPTFEEAEEQWMNWSPEEDGI